MDTVATRAYLLGLQARIVAGLEAVGGEPFRRDEWTRPEGGGGLSRLIENGRVLERGARNAERDGSGYEQRRRHDAQRGVAPKLAGNQQHRADSQSNHARQHSPVHHSATPTIFIIPA